MYQYFFYYYFFVWEIICIISTQNDSNNNQCQSSSISLSKLKEFGVYKVLKFSFDFHCEINSTNIFYLTKDYLFNYRNAIGTCISTIWLSKIAVRIQLSEYVQVKNCIFPFKNRVKMFAFALFGVDQFIKSNRSRESFMHISDVKTSSNYIMSIMLNTRITYYNISLEDTETADVEYFRLLQHYFNYRSNVKIPT